MASLAEYLKTADLTNYPNHIIVLGTDAARDGEQSYPAAYHDYRRRWARAGKAYHLEPFPLHLDFETTNACNLRCTMCGIDFDAEPAKLMKLDLYRKVIDEAAARGLPSIKLNFRGEPLLHKQLPEMVKYAKDQGILDVQFNTNAVLLDDRRSRALIEAGLDRIIVSFDGAKRETYNLIRRGSDFDRVYANVKRFVEIRDSLGLVRPLVRVQTVCMKSTQDEVTQFIDLWKDIANRIGFIRLKCGSNSIPVRILTHNVDQVIEEHQTVAIPCRQLWQRLVICVDGRVVMCCGDQKAELVLGNANETPIADIWTGHLESEARRLHLDGRSDEVAPCASCAINKVSMKQDWAWLEDFEALRSGVTSLTPPAAART
jgi:radical SAM protein with 4Fe4S-binding SPASM domain